MQMPHRGQQMPRPAQGPGGGGGGGLTPGSSEALGRAREIQPRSTSDLARNSDSHAAAIMSQARELIDSVKRRRERESGGGDFNGVVVKVEGQPAKVSRPSEPARSGAGPADQGLAEGAAAGGGGGDVQFGGSRSREARASSPLCCTSATSRHPLGHISGTTRLLVGDLSATARRLPLGCLPALLACARPLCRSATPNCAPRRSTWTTTRRAAPLEAPPSRTTRRPLARCGGCRAVSRSGTTRTASWPWARSRDSCVYLCPLRYLRQGAGARTETGSGTPPCYIGVANGCVRGTSGGACPAPRPSCVKRRPTHLSKHSRSHLCCSAHKNTIEK